MANSLGDRYRDLMPPAGWQPKSAFFRAIWAKASFKVTHPQLTLLCPHCGEELVIQATVITGLTPPPQLSKPES